MAQGTSPLKDDGTFEAKFLPEADERLAEGANEVIYLFGATAAVTDEGGETREDARSFRLGVVAVEATVRIDAGFVREGDSARLTIARTDLDGAPSPGEGSWRLLSVVQPGRTLLPRRCSSTSRPRSMTASQLRATGCVRAGIRACRSRRRCAIGPTVRRRPAATCPTTRRVRRRSGCRPCLPGRGGCATRRGTFRRPLETTKDFFVAGKRTRIALPEVLVAERESVSPGEMARFLVASGLPDQVLYFEVLRGGKVVLRRSIPSLQSGVIEVPVPEEYRGGFAVRLSLVRDHQFLTLGSSVLVPWDDKKLEVSFATFRDRIRPGARETWRVTVKAPAGTPSEGRAAELLAYMYDRSLDVFGEPQPPQPLSVYPDGSGDSGLFSNLGPIRWEWVSGRDFGASPVREALRADQLKFEEGYGIGGPGMRMAGVGMLAKTRADATDALAAPAMEGGFAVTAQETVVTVTGESPAIMGHGEAAAAPPVLRSDFSETAFWKPAAPDRAGRVRRDRVPGAGLRDVLERLGPRDHPGLQVGLAPPGDAKRQGPHGAAVRAALPARGGLGGA